MIGMYRPEKEKIEAGAYLIIEINDLMRRGGFDNLVQAGELKKELKKIDANIVDMVHRSGILRRERKYLNDKTQN